MLSHLSTNFDLQKYYQNEPKLNGVYSRNNLPKIKDREYEINLDEYKSTGPQWIALYMNGKNKRALYDKTYFDSFGVEHNRKEISKSRENKNILTNIYKI